MKNITFIPKYKMKDIFIDTMINEVRISANNSPKKVFGSLKMNYLTGLYLPLTILAPCYSYYMAVDRHHEVKPFPHSTITQTAELYPQNIFFRCTMGIASTILVLAFYTIFRWIHLQAEMSGFRKRISKIVYYLVMFSMVAYTITIETLDGKGQGPLHTPSAITFFIIWEIAIVYVTLFLYELRQWDSSTISLTSLRLKAGLAIYVTLVWFYCLYKAYGKGQNSIDYTVVVEWNAFLINLMWILSFITEWKQIKISLIGPA